MFVYDTYMSLSFKVPLICNLLQGLHATLTNEKNTQVSLFDTILNTISYKT